MPDEIIKVDPELLTVARDIFQTLSEQRADHSFSFTLTDEGYRAVLDSIKVVEWGIGANKSKLKATALEVINEIAGIDQGLPVNVNMDEYDIKSIGEVVLALEKALESNVDGELK